MLQLELPFKFKKDKEEPDWSWIRREYQMTQRPDFDEYDYVQQRMQAQHAAYESQIRAYQTSLDGWSASPRRSWYQRIFGG